MRVQRVLSESGGRPRVRGALCGAAVLTGEEPPSPRGRCAERLFPRTWRRSRCEPTRAQLSPAARGVSGRCRCEL